MNTLPKGLSLREAIISFASKDYLKLPNMQSQSGEIVFPTFMNTYEFWESHPEYIAHLLTIQQCLWADLVVQAMHSLISITGCKYNCDREAINPMELRYFKPNIKLNTISAFGLTYGRILVFSENLKSYFTQEIPYKKMSKRLDFTEQDMPFILTMIEMIKKLEASGPKDAAWRIVSDSTNKVLGEGNPESKVKRLLKGYKMVRGQSVIS